MKLLIAVATKEEIQPFLESSSSKTSPAVEILITGVGMVATAYALGKRLSEEAVDVLLNIGIGGAFSENTPLGSLFRISEDRLSELGAENGEYFLSSDDLDLGNSCFYEQINPLAHLETIKRLQAVKGITVNQVHGNTASILKIKERISPDVESMEGAAVFYAAKKTGTPVVQIRGISNIIEQRNKNNWNISLAIRNLNNWLVQFVEEFNAYNNELTNKK